jgi:hypothetical protein
MKVTEVYYLERVKTTDYAFKELKMTAVIEEDDNAAECTRMLEGLVKSQLGLIKGDLNVNITKTETKPVAPITEGTKVETPKAPKKTRKTKAKAEKVVEVAVEVVTKEEVQNSLRDVAVFHKDASKAVALIEQVAGVKTLADVPESKYAEIVAMAKKVVA